MANETFLARLKYCVRKLGGASETNKITGINTRTLNHWLAGEREPKVFALSVLAQAASVSVDWLLFGKGNSDFKAVTETSVQTLVDPELFRWIIDGLAKLYKETGIRMPPHEMGYKAAVLHNEIIQEFSDLDQQRSALKLLLRAYRSELIAQPIQPGKPKEESG